MKKFIAILAAIMLVFSMSSCSLTADDAADPAYRTLRYEGGDVGGSKFKECVKEGDKLASNDAFYSYPNTQRQDKWDSANFQQGAKSADYGDMELAAQGGVSVNMKVTVPFFLNTSCETIDVDGKSYPGGAIQVFHELIGKTRNAYFDPTTDGNGSYGSGWLWAMDTYLSNCVTSTLTPEIRKRDAETLWLNDSVRQDISDSIDEDIQTCVDDAMETDVQFYRVGNATVDRITPDEQFVGLYRERQEAETRADTAELNKKVQVREAEAKAAVARAEAKIKQAEIRGYGGFGNYRCIYLADAGLNCAQPQYVVGGTR